MKKFTESHEWIECASDIATVGITKFAVQEIGETVHVELPPVGKKLRTGDVAAVLESTKAAIDIVTPISGEVIATNSSLETEIEKMNHSPEEEGWLFKLRPLDTTELDGLMDRSSYEKMMKQ